MSRRRFLSVLRESFKRDAVYLAPGATKGAGGVFSQYKSDTVFRSTVVGKRHLMIFGAGLKRKKHTTHPTLTLVDADREDFNTIKKLSAKSSVVGIDQIIQIKSNHFIC